MAGYRIRAIDPTWRGKVLVVDTGRIYPTPYLCPLCKRVEETKRWHLDLDGEGTRIVSSTVLERMTLLGLVAATGAPFTFENVVEKPPTLVIAQNGSSELEKRALADLTPAGLTVRISPN